MKTSLLTRDVLELCDDRRNLKKRRYEVEGQFKEANKRI